VKWKLAGHKLLDLGALGKTTTQGKETAGRIISCWQPQVKVSSNAEADSDIVTVRERSVE
jgi:hypothetical protein